MDRYDDQVQQLKKHMQDLAGSDVIVAFSGGVDSSLLVRLAVDAAKGTGRTVYAVTVKMMLQPSREEVDPERLAKSLGAQPETLTVHARELEEAGILENPLDRCYLCKKLLYERILKKGEELGVDVVLDGTNADDLNTYRPGLTAVLELGIRSPMAEIGFTKAQVRKLAAELEISTAERPAAPCLATRFPYGVKLEESALRRVDEAEALLRTIVPASINVRVRVHGQTARIETDPDAFDLLVAYRQEIVSRFKDMGYDYVTLDLSGFQSGSMDKAVLTDPG